MTSPPAGTTDVAKSAMRAFLRRAATVSIGSVGAQAVALASAPILTRMYPVHAFDAFAVYTSATAVLAASASFRMSHAIVTEADEQSALEMMRSCIVLSCGLAVAVAVGLVGLGQTPLWTRLHFDVLGDGALLVPFGVGVAGILESVTHWTNRKTAYRALTTSRVLVALITAISACALFRVQSGLLFSSFLGQLSGLLFLLWQPHLRSELGPSYRWWNGALIRKHRRFAFFAWPADLLNVFGSQLPTFALNAHAPSGVTGQLAMSNRVLGLPIQFVSSALAEVFRQQASRDYHENGTCKPVFWRTFKLLALLSVVPFLILFFFGPWLFATAFGEKWREAGFLTRLLIPMFFMRFSVSPLSYVVYLANKQHYSLLSDIFNTGCLLVWTTLFARGIWDHKQMLLAYAASYSFAALVTLWLAARATVKPPDAPAEGEATA